jgi:hypothetical protein
MHNLNSAPYDFGYRLESTAPNDQALTFPLAFVLGFAMMGGIQSALLGANSTNLVSRTFWLCFP